MRQARTRALRRIHLGHRANPTRLAHLPPSRAANARRERQSTAGNVFKVGLDDMDDFEALQRTMGEAAGISVEIAKGPEAQAAPTGRTCAIAGDAVA